MLKSVLLTAACATLFATVPNLALAASIKAQLSADQLATVCGGLPADTVKTVSLSLGDGTSLTGTVHCESKDVAEAATDTPDPAPGVTPPAASDDSLEAPETEDHAPGSLTGSGEHEGGDDHGGTTAGTTGSTSGSSGNSGSSGESGKSGSGEHSGGHD